MQSQNDIRLGKFISLILRHKPETIGITLDEQGWADVEELIKAMKKAGKEIDKKKLECIVAENEKQRYIFNENHTKIRANQGHSIAVDLQLEQKQPPEILYHGTATRFLESIKKEGLKKMTRQHVHLSKEKQTAVYVGKRHGRPVVLKVYAKKMYQKGHHFYLSENGIWLCDAVPWEYLEVLSNQ